MSRRRFAEPVTCRADVFVCVIDAMDVEASFLFCLAQCNLFVNVSHWFRELLTTRTPWREERVSAAVRFGRALAGGVPGGARIFEK